MVNFIVSDFVASLNIAKAQYMVSIRVRNTKFVRKILYVMLNLGVIRDITYLDNNFVEVFLKYYKKRCTFNKIKVISVPSRRKYIDVIKLIRLKNKYGNAVIFILSTHKGVYTDSYCIMNNICGEIILKIEL